MRTFPFPETPAQVRKCLMLAAEGALTVKRDDASAIVIMPFEEYARLVALEPEQPDSDD